jgi:drug/metabolite transporter (DMT)-like permease
MHMLQALAQFLTVLSCGLFAGAAMYITLVERPARRECTTEVAVTEFRPRYRRAAVMQASLAALGFVCSIAAWLVEHHWGWLPGASSWWQLFLLRFLPSGRSTRGCWIRRLTEVRSTQGSFSYGGDDCMRCVAY